MTATIAPAIPTTTLPKALRTRTLHLVVLENLVGDPHADGATAAHVFGQYLQRAHWEAGDLVHVADNPHLALEVGWRLPVDCTLRTASGPDAADHRLMDLAEPEFVARRFGRLVIGSGDHGFIAHACASRTAGVGVLVVTRPGSLANGWRAWGFPIATLDLDDEPTLAA
jgi:hypothetical protein